jgi:hypothetical protein
VESRFKKKKDMKVGGGLFEEGGREQKEGDEG